MSEIKVNRKSKRGVKRHHPLIATFAHNLTRLRTERGLTKTELAKKADVDVAHLGRLERGGGPSLDILARLADALVVPVSALTAPDADRFDSIEPLRAQIRESLERTLAQVSKPELHALAIVISAVGRAKS